MINSMSKEQLFKVERQNLRKIPDGSRTLGFIKTNVREIIQTGTDTSSVTQRINTISIPFDTVSSVILLTTRTRL